VRLYSVDAQNHTNVLDQVNFETIAPWNTAADDGGASLQAIDPAVDNSRVGNWTAVPANPGPQWQHVIQQGTASSSTVYIYLETVGDVYVDDVVLVAGTTAEVGQNFISNGDFESALSGPWGVSPNLANSSLSTTVKHSGNASLHVITTSGGTTRGSAIYQDLSTALTQGAAYTLSYWYLPNTNGGTLTIRLSGSGIKSTVNIAPTGTTLARVTPDAANDVRASLTEFPPVWINEVLPNNVSGITDGQGEHEPWIELINTGNAAVDLSGWYLTANYASLAGWAFPNGTTVPAGGFLTIFADGQPADTTATELHTSFRLPTSNGRVALVRPQATGLAVVDYVNYGAIAADTSLASIPDGQAFTRQQTTSVTPGAFNAVSANRAPTITNPGAQTVQAGQVLNFTVAASDPDQPLQTITYSLDAAPLGASIGASSGLFSWNPTAAQVGTSSVTVRVTDSGVPPLSATATFNIDVTPNHAPSIVNPGSQTVQFGTPINFTVSASDPDQPQQTLTFSLDTALAGATIDGASGAFSWTPSSTQVGVNAIRVRVTDNGAPPLSATADFSITVTSPNRPPVITNPGAQTVIAGQTLNFTVAASDPDQPAQSIAFSLDTPPQGATINASTGAFSWTPGSAQVGTNTIRVRVTDYGTPPLSVTADFNVVVKAANRPPVVTSPGAQTVKVGQLLSFTVSASDPDQPAQTIAFSLDTPPQGASINASTGAFTWTPTSAQAGTNTLHVRVTDNGTPPLSATADFNVVVTATQSGSITVTGTVDVTGNPTINWTSQTGVTYRVEYKNSLNDATWTLLNESTATGSSMSIVDPNPGQQRFYHVVAP
jgi:hypothetical protein